MRSALPKPKRLLLRLTSGSRPSGSRRTPTGAAEIGTSQASLVVLVGISAYATSPFARRTSTWLQVGTLPARETRPRIRVPSLTMVTLVRAWSPFDSG